jgi:hypothetical protein
MKVTVTDFGDYTEELCEPDDPPNSDGAKTNGRSGAAQGIITAEP